MEATAENLQALAAYLTQTLSEKYEVRKPAEDYLMSVEATPNYAMLLLQLTDSDQVEMHIRLAASINFKNFVKRNWRIIEDQPNKVCINVCNINGHVCTTTLYRTLDTLSFHPPTLIIHNVYPTWPSMHAPSPPTLSRSTAHSYGLVIPY